MKHIVPIISRTELLVVVPISSVGLKQINGLKAALTGEPFQYPGCLFMNLTVFFFFVFLLILANSGQYRRRN